MNPKLSFAIIGLSTSFYFISIRYYVNGFPKKSPYLFPNIPLKKSKYQQYFTHMTNVSFINCIPTISFWILQQSDVSLSTLDNFNSLFVLGTLVPQIGMTFYHLKKLREYRKKYCKKYRLKQKDVHNLELMCCTSVGICTVCYQYFTICLVPPLFYYHFNDMFGKYV